MAKKNEVGIHAIWDNKDFQRGMRAYQAGLKDASKVTKKTTKQMSAMGKETAALGQVWKVTAGIIGVYGVAQILRGGVALAKLGAQSKRMRTSFMELARQAGASGNAILESLRSASRGTIEDTSLMLSANRAMMLGLGADSEQLGKLMQVAAFRGKAMGLTVQQAFSDMTTGIGRKSIMILDNLGIVGLQMDKTTTQAEIMAQVISQGMKQIVAAGGAAGDEAEAFERMNASIANVKAALGELFAPTVASGAQALADGINVWTKNFEMLSIIIDKLNEKSMTKATAAANDWKDATDDSRYAVAAAVQTYIMAQTEIDNLARAELKAQAAAAGTSVVVMDLDAATQAYEASLSNQITAGMQSTKTLDAQSSAMARQIPIVNLFPKSIAEMRVSYGLLNAMLERNIIDQQTYNNMLRIATKNFESYSKQTERTARIVAKYTALAASGMDKVTKATLAANQASQDYIATLFEEARALAGKATILGYVPRGATYREQKELEEFQLKREAAAIRANKGAADDFRAKMEGANNIIADDIASKVHDALGLGADVGDQPAEPARRLLDIAKLGETSPWAEGMRQAIANAWDKLRPGEGIGAAILGDEGTMKVWADKLYNMIADPRMGAGLLTQLELATGDEWVDHLALMTEVGVQQGIDAFVTKGWEAFESGGGNIQTAGAGIGNELAKGVQTGLSMPGAGAPLQPLEKDLTNVITKIETFRGIWNNLNDKNITLFVDIESSGGGGGGNGGGGGGSTTSAPTSIPYTSYPGIFGQHGLDMIVPSGYSRDTFPVFVSSRERIIVQTPAQQAAGGKTITMGPIYINNGMDLQTFEANVRRVVGDDLQ